MTVLYGKQGSGHKYVLKNIVLIVISIINLNDYNIDDLQCDQCLDLRIGVQTREVRCALNNGTLLDNTKCHSQEKPIAQKQCVNDLCEGTWITGDWTQVSNCQQMPFLSLIRISY